MMDLARQVAEQAEVEDDQVDDGQTQQVDARRAVTQPPAQHDAHRRHVAQRAQRQDDRGAADPDLASEGCVVVVCHVAMVAGVWCEASV